MYREGNKRSIFANIVEICKKMHRQPEHVIQFLFAELGTSGSVDGSGRLVIKGRFQQSEFRPDLSLDAILITTPIVQSKLRTFFVDISVSLPHSHHSTTRTDVSPPPQSST